MREAQGLIEAMSTLWALMVEIVQAFYNGVPQSIRFTIDTAAGDTFMNKTEDKAYDLIKEMTLNNY